MNFFIISFVVIAIVIIFLYKKIKQGVGLLIFLLFILVLVVSFWSVYSSNDLSLNNFGDFVNAGKVYFNWVAGVFGNTKSLAGYAIKQNWSTPLNSVKGLINATNLSGG